MSISFSAIVNLYKIFYNSISPYPFNLYPDIGADRWHRAFIEHLAILLKPKVYLELGIRDCSVLNRIIPHADKIIGVDIDRKAGEFMIKSPKAEFICSSTQEYIKLLQTKPISIDMLFIDADHAHDALIKDFWAYFQMITPHGIILLHDTHPKDDAAMSPIFCNDAYKAIEEFAKASDQLELMTLPLHPGLTLCRKRQKQLSWHEQSLS